MKDGLCTKDYPKLPRDTTSVNVNGYPEYRRREVSPPLTVKNGELGVGSVVPRNISLLEKYKCHLNVEVCTSIKAVKYLYKHTYKGPDRACLERAVDEVAEFLDARYVGAPEVAWRLLQYPLHGKSHIVERLAVHLPLGQNVLFTPGEEQESMDRARQRRTKLEAWFDLNNTCDQYGAEVAAATRNSRYHEIPR